MALDFVYTNYKEIDQSPQVGRDSQIFEDSESSIGYGLGLLITAFESDRFRVDIGAAYNSRVDFQFDLDQHAARRFPHPFGESRAHELGTQLCRALTGGFGVTLTAEQRC